MDWQEDFSNPKKPQYRLESTALDLRVGVGLNGWSWSATVYLDGDKLDLWGSPDVDARWGGEEKAKSQSVIQVREELLPLLDSEYFSDSSKTCVRDIVASLDLVLAQE